MKVGQVSKDVEVGGVGLGLSYVLYLSYELAKEGWGDAVMKYPGLGHWLEGSFLLVARFNHCMGDISLVITEGVVFTCTLGSIFTVMDFILCLVISCNVV